MQGRRDDKSKRSLRNQGRTFVDWGWDGRARCGSGQVFEALPETLMWTPTDRAQHSLAGLRYGSDVTDAEWLIVSSFLPASTPCGRHRK